MLLASWHAASLMCLHVALLLLSQSSLDCAGKRLVCSMQRTCTWRLFSQYNNVSYINTWSYAIEMAFHEALLQACLLSPQLY